MLSIKYSNDLLTLCAPEKLHYLLLLLLSIYLETKQNKMEDIGLKKLQIEAKLEVVRTYY